MEQLQGWLSVRDAALRLGVSSGRVRGLVAAGQLPAVRPGRDLLVAADAVAHRELVVRPRAGRPWSPRMAWAVLWVASGLRPGWVSSAELVRVRRYARQDQAEWPRLLAARAANHRVRMLPGVLRRVRAMPGVRAGGAEAAAAHGSNLLTSLDAVQELYASAEVARRLRDVRGIRWSPSDPNVVLRVLPDLPDSVVAQVLGEPVMPVAVAAADLLEQGNERAARAAEELVAATVTA